MGKGKNGNLMPPTTNDEARKRGKNGGIKSGVARKKKRTMQAAVKLLLDMPVAFENVKQQMHNLGIDDEDLTNQMAVVVSMFKQSMAGNVKAAEFLRETAGTGASGIERSDRLAMDKERFELDKERRKNESENADNDGMPVIIDVRPQEDKGNATAEEQ